MARACIKCYTFKLLSEFRTPAWWSKKINESCNDCLDQRKAAVLTPIDERKAIAREKANLKRIARESSPNVVPRAIRSAFSSRVCSFFSYKGCKKPRTSTLLGCDYLTAKKYIERQFTKGMTWENHGIGEGKWQIDHKIPLSSAKNLEEMKILCHYRNLQPLWAIDNNRKKAKILPYQLALTI